MGKEDYFLSLLCHNIKAAYNDSQTALLMCTFTNDLYFRDLAPSIWKVEVRIKDTKNDIQVTFKIFFTIHMVTCACLVGIVFIFYLGNVRSGKNKFICDNYMPT